MPSAVASAIGPCERERFSGGIAGRLSRGRNDGEEAPTFGSAGEQTVAVGSVYCPSEVIICIGCAAGMVSHGIAWGKVRISTPSTRSTAAVP